MVYHSYFIDLLQFWPYDARFLASFLASVRWNPTLTSSTYLAILPCLPLSFDSYSHIVLSSLSILLTVL
jgi:hypothetical protein